jgi:Ras GTPase-activating-like protein IQGAP2/3
MSGPKKNKFTSEDVTPRGQMKASGGMSGADLDAARRRNTAYEYLCHLEEARQWIQACLKIELPPAFELEGALRNGIIVAKLAVFFAPDSVKGRNVYDIDEKVYQAKGLVFRHTDNISQWIKGMRAVKFPDMFYPEVTDLYDKKNMPRVIYCIHALSRYLYHLGIAPEIEDLHGIAQFTEEEISAIDKELQKSGVQMPKFGKIGGILAKEMGEDDAAMHAAVLKINQCLETKAEVPELMQAMKHPAAGIKKIEPNVAGDYRRVLIAARETKADAAGSVIDNVDRDVYDTNLTKAEIQKEVNMINAAEAAKVKDAAFVAINKAVDKGDRAELVSKLKEPAAELTEVDDNAGTYYMSSLTKAKASAGGPLGPKQVQDSVDSGNAAFQQQKQMDEAVKSLVATAKAGDLDKFMELLRRGSQWFGDCTAEAGKRYMEGVARLDDKATAENVKKVVQDVNAQLDKEAVVKAAVKRVNDAVDAGQPESTLAALKQSALALSDVDDAGAFMYQDMLKAKKDAAGTSLDIPAIQRVIQEANTAAEENAKRAAALFALHEAVRSGDPGKTLAALKDPVVGVQPVWDDAEERYQDALSIAVKNKERAVGQTVSRWKKFETDDGSRTYYFNKETKETVWIPPPDMLEPQLTVAEVQDVIDRCNTEQARWNEFVAAEPSMVNLQAHVRGLLARRKFNDRMNFLKGNEKSVVKIQAHTRGMLQRKKYLDRKAFLANQAAVVVKLQALWKGVKARREYDNLTKVTAPPVVTVRKFLHLLDQSDLDFAEELRVQTLKEKVVTEIKQNKNLESDLNEMDIKIGLLVRNRIELQDVVKQSKKLKQAGRHVEGGSSLSLNTPASALAAHGLKSLNKEARERLGSYQHLFYLLQTNPNYLARLVFIDQPLDRWTLVKAQKFVNHLIDTVYNFGSNAREKYQLLKLYRAAMEKEVLVKVDQTRDFIVGNPAVIRLVVLHHRDRDPYLKETLGPVINKVIQSEEDLNPDPCDIYKRWIGQQESQTGEKSQLPYEVPREEALRHEHVKNIFDKTSQRLLDVCGEFLDAIVKALPKLPYGLRYICMKLREDLNKKFPEADEEEVLKVLGNILYYRFINPIITTPELVDVFPPNVSNQLANNARRNLACIARTLQLSASGQLYDNDMTKSDNQFLAKAWETFKAYFDQAANVESLEDHFKIDEYSDAVMLTKPTIYISPEAIFHTHEIISNNVDEMAPDAHDPLRVILSDLGSPGDETVVLGEEGSQQQLNNRTEISLTLTNKFEVPESDDTSMRTLFVRTKKLVIDVIRFQEGRNLLDILETPATEEMEK